MIESHTSRINAGFSGLQTNIRGLKNNVGVIKSNVSGIKTNVNGLKTNVGVIKTNIGKYTPSVNNAPSSLEAESARQALSEMISAHQESNRAILESLTQFKSEHISDKLQKSYFDEVIGTVKSEIKESTKKEKTYFEQMTESVSSLTDRIQSML